MIGNPPGHFKEGRRTEETCPVCRGVQVYEIMWQVFDGERKLCKVMVRECPHLERASRTALAAIRKLGKRRR
jgi:hypothetical protein